MNKKTRAIYIGPERLADPHILRYGRTGWAYLGACVWNDPITGVNMLTSLAHKVMVQRANRKPRLIRWQDWMGIAKELRRQLKPFGLTVKTRGVSQKKGDFIRWTVSKTS